jgi:hypothetical protein
LKKFKEYAKLVKNLPPKYWDGDDESTKKKPVIKEQATYEGTKDHTYEPQNDLKWASVHNTPYLTPEEKHSVKTYAAGSDWKTNIETNPQRAPYRTINDHLRFNNIKPEHEEIVNNHVKNLDSAIDKHTTHTDLHVWRGLAGYAQNSGPHDEFTSLTPGDTFHDKGFTSTSFRPITARGFGMEFKSFPDGTEEAHEHLAHIHVPSGHKALYLQHHDLGNGYEHEVLLPRNAKFKYMGKETHEKVNDYRPTSKNITHIHHLQYIGKHEET